MAKETTYYTATVEFNGKRYFLGEYASNNPEHVQEAAKNDLSVMLNLNVEPTKEGEQKLPMLAGITKR